jgi:hypothetical protein
MTNMAAGNFLCGSQIAVIAVGDHAKKPRPRTACLAPFCALR